VTQTITAAQLGRRINRSRDLVHQWLAEWRRLGLVEETQTGWRLTRSGRLQLDGFAQILDDLAAEHVPVDGATTVKSPAPAKREVPEYLTRARCSCGCGGTLASSTSNAAFLPGHRPAKKLHPREQLRREREADADRKPVVSTCARSGQSFGPGPVTIVRTEFRQHACEVAA